MNQINALLEKRLGKKDPKQKMKSLATQSGDGRLSSFAGVFQVSELSSDEKEQLQEILLSYSKNSQEGLQSDLESLIRLTSEVKAINNQAALLHGERIKKAQEILLAYAEGAFSAWLIEAYGNRQTPYNLLQYYEFYVKMPKALHPQIDAMPRQAIYTLASRKGDFMVKKELVINYKGESKKKMLELIREKFPLPKGDKRRVNSMERVIKLLQELEKEIQALSQAEKLRVKQQFLEML